MSSLVVDTNLSALNALNTLNQTDNQETSAISELSSGLKIQSAATGPAQYVIAQSLEAQANGYTQAINNAQNGVSLIQTASGALSQISSILQTMDQLALTSANGATATTTSLAANQSEFSDLVNSIDEIAKTTTFGTSKLLVGKVTTATPTGSPTTAYSGSLQVGAFNTADQRITLSVSAVTAKALGFTGTATGAKVTSTTLATGKWKPATGKQTLTFKATGGTFTVTFTKTVTYTIAQVVTKINSTAGLKDLVTAKVTATGKKFSLTTKETGATAKLDVTADTGIFTAQTKVGSAGSGAVSLSTSADAQAAVTSVQSAIKTVDKMASNVGAIQNELSAIVANLTVGQQNLSAANSQLVDVNMAQEMTAFSTDQILMQTGVAMLGQAQQAPSLVLKLI